MKKMSLQWRLTCITTLCIAIICGCLTMFVYKNGVYYMDSLQKAVDAQGDDSGGGSEEIYISIPEDKWDEFSNDFSVQVYNNKEDYKRNSLIVSALLDLLGGVSAYFISGHALITRCLNASRMHLRYRDNLLRVQHMSFELHYR